MGSSSIRTRVAGEHWLPGGRVALFPLLLALVACGTPASSTTGDPAPTAGPSASARPAIPTLGGPAATGIVLASYFVTVVESRYGLVSAVTTPGSSCTAEVTLPDGTRLSSDGLRTARTADPNGRVAFEYPATPTAPGTGLHGVGCELAGQRQQARARFEVR